MTETSPIKIDREILGGTPCFHGTRVPIAILVEHLQEGISTEDFLIDFPGVAYEQVKAVLEFAKTDIVYRADSKDV